MRSRILELDALRGIAALSVVIYHYTTRYNVLYGFEEFPAYSFPLGHYGVQLFFVVSGFVIFLTLNNCRHPADFIVSRFARLYPVYWAAIVVTFSVVALFGLEGREVTPAQAVFNLTMLQGYFDIPDVDGVYWTLKWELVFYFWAFMLFISNQQRHVLYAVALILVSQWISCLFEANVRNLPGIIKLLTLNTYGNLFCAGILFYHLMHSNRRPFVHVLIAIALFNQILVHNIESFYVSCIIFATFYLFAYGKLEFIARKPLVILGTISYSLYLIHEYVGWILMRELMALGFSSTAAVSTALVMAVGLALSLTYGVEHPAMNKIKSAYKEKYRFKIVRSS